METGRIFLFFSFSTGTSDGLLTCNRVFQFGESGVIDRFKEWLATGHSARGVCGNCMNM